MIERQRKLYLDYSPFGGRQCVHPGDYLVGKRVAYLIQGVRMSKTIPHRHHLTVVRWPREEIPFGANVHSICWYSRKRRPR